MNDESLEVLDKFKYLGATLTKYGKSEIEINISRATATSTLVRLITIWMSRNISLHTKILLYNSLILSILLYSNETWILTERLERRITAFEHNTYKRILGITYRERKTNYYVYQIIFECICQVEHLLSKVKRRKMSYFGHTMHYDSLNKTVIQGCVFSKRRRGRSRKN